MVLLLQWLVLLVSVVNNLFEVVHFLFHIFALLHQLQNLLLQIEISLFKLDDLHAHLVLLITILLLIWNSLFQVIDHPIGLLKLDQSPWEVKYGVGLQASLDQFRAVFDIFLLVVLINFIILCLPLDCKLWQIRIALIIRGEYLQIVIFLSQSILHHGVLL